LKQRRNEENGTANLRQAGEDKYTNIKKYHTHDKRDKYTNRKKCNTHQLKQTRK